MSRLAQQTKIAKGTKRAAGLRSDSFAPAVNDMEEDSLRSEDTRMLWKCAAMAKQIMVQIRTATAVRRKGTVSSMGRSMQQQAPDTHHTHTRERC